AYERLVAGRKVVQAAGVAVLLALCAAGSFELFQARQVMLEKAAVTTQAPTSYVDDEAKTATPPEPAHQNGSEAESRHRFGLSTLLFALAAEVGLAFLFGQITHLRNDDDYTAWTRLHTSEEIRLAIEEKIAELLASVEIA